MNITPQQLSFAPELGLLAAIGHALRLAERILVTRHPELDITDDWALEQPSSCTVARPLADAIVTLRDALEQYHGAIEQELHEHDQILLEPAEPDDTGWTDDDLPF